MAEEIAFGNGRISNFEGLVKLTLTLDRVTLHTIVHHSSTSIPTRQISLKSKKLFVNGRTDGRTFETGFIRSTLSNTRPKNFAMQSVSDKSVMTKVLYRRYAARIYCKPEGHIVVLGSPSPVQVGVAVDSLKMLGTHVEHSAYQLLIRQSKQQVRAAASTQKQ